MKLSLFKVKLNVVKIRYKHMVEPLKKLASHFIDLDVIIPGGEYKGRWGKITQVHIDTDGDVIAIVVPYRIVGDTNNLISHAKPGARTFWKLNEVTEIREPEEYKNNKERY